MTRLPVRLLVIVLALTATGALGYRVFRADLGIGATLDGARRSDQAVASTRLALAGLDATMRSLVAPGQRPRTWSEDAERQLDVIRESLIALEGAGTSTGEHPLDGALDSVDRLAASAARARSHMDEGQALLASDVVFNDIKDTVASIDQQVGRTGSLERGRHAAALSSLRQEQGLLVGAVVAVWLFTAILLVPSARGSRAVEAPSHVSHATFGDLGVEVRTPDTSQADPGTVPAQMAPDPAACFVAAASLCTDLAGVVDSRDLGGLLERTAGVLEASGVIVWVAGGDGEALFPVASHGYDEQTIARIGSIRRDAANLTAAAYRDAALKTSRASGPSAAALASPLIGPGGACGVLSAELRQASEVSSAAAALATILSAQLGTLVGTMPASSTDEAPPAQQANA